MKPLRALTLRTLAAIANFKQVPYAAKDNAVTAWDPTNVVLMQFQIPTDPNAAIAWDFCVEGLTAITQ
jgi:hypothetical protein